MTRKEFVTKAVESLSETYSPGESKAIAIRIITHFLHLSEYEYSVDPNIAIPKSELTPIQESLQELADNRPVQYVIGYENFAGHKFNVSESVLIPRPETEELCRKIIGDWQGSDYSKIKILDLCTGSGCIAYTLAAAFPKSEVFACDISEDAIKVAKGQKVFLDEGERQPISNPPIIFRRDILTDIPDEKDLQSASESLPNIEDLDIIVSNPPYVCESEKDFMSPNVLDYEPDEALFVPDNDPLRFYKAIAEWALSFLKLGGKCYVEINEAYGQQVKDLFESYGYSEVEVMDDIRSKPRFVKFVKWF